ncbi:ankyrin repeat domain-containing protein [archaeon]|nr:MAG: ankyrin repeat domain-containing protein [archaeon]
MHIAIQVLLEHDAEVNAQTSAGRTPLMFAVEFEHTHLVKYICLQREAYKAG